MSHKIAKLVEGCQANFGRFTSRATAMIAKHPFVGTGSFSLPQGYFFLPSH